MGPRGGGGFGFLHLIAGLVGLALFVAVVLGLVALALGIARKKGWVSAWKRRHGPGRGRHPEPGAPPHGSPGPWEALRILDERLARGEIEIDDYHARRNALDGAGYPPFQQPPAPPTPPAPPAPQAPGHPPDGQPPTREEPQQPAH
ncbi:MAG: hypothetical protein QM695_13120 [Micropruina sp.]